MRAAGVVWTLRKDLRSLLPIWLACAATLGAASGYRAWLGLPSGATRNGVEGLAILAYGLGSIALGAQIIGAEYGSRTLPSLLTLPASRWQILLGKVVTLACLLAGLVLLAPAPWRPREPEINTILRLGPVYGLCVAPFLTMVCRGTLPGIVFTAALAPVLFDAGQIAGSAIYGSAAAAEIDWFTYSFLRNGTILLCAAGVVLTVRAFLRLEATEASGLELRVPRALRGEQRPARRRSPIGLLIAKELRLQRMSFIVAALYGAAWLAALMMKRIWPDLDVPPLGTGAALYFSLVAVLIGSLASAEERQFGTTEWQALVPIASSRQWFVKIGVTFFLALAFYATAVVFARLTLPPGDGPSTGALLLLGVGLVLWTSAGLYASSLSTSGVRALALSLVLLLAMTFVVPLIGRMEWWVIDLIAAPDWPVYAAMAFAHPSVNVALTQALVAGFVTLLLRLAFTNHRSAETGAARVWRQSALLVGYIAVALMINGLVRLG